MTHRKTAWICLLLCLLLALSACGGSKSEPAVETEIEAEPELEAAADYQQLEALLNRGQYDAAISWIESLRENSERVVETIDVDEQTSRMLAEITGDYSRRASNSFAEYGETLTVRPDMTILMDGKTYSFEIDNINDGSEGSTYVNIKYSYLNEDNNTSYSWLSFCVYPSGYVTAGNESYQQTDFVEAMIAEQFPSLIGDYKRSYDNRTFSIREDRTVAVDGGEPTRIFFQPNWNDHSVLNLYYTNSEGYISELSFKHDEKNLLRLNSSFYRMSDLNIVTLTADNLMDYFEWTDWRPNVTRNAFGDISEFSISRYLKLKDMYAGSLFVEETSITMEVERQSDHYNTASIAWDPSTDTVTVELPNFPNSTSDPSTTILSRIQSQTRGAEEDYALDFYYLTSEWNYNTSSEAPEADEAGIYHSTFGWFSISTHPDVLTVLRNDSTLAFIQQ